MSTTETIPIANYNNRRARRGIVVERTFPAILQGHMSLSEWDMFCNNIDKTVAPLGIYRRNHFLRTINAVILFLIFCGVAVYLDGREVSNTVEIILGGFLIIIFFTYPCSFFYLRSQFQVLEIQLNGVLASESRKKANVSFSLIDKPGLGKAIHCVVTSASVGVASDVSAPPAFVPENKMTALNSFDSDTGVGGTNALSPTNKNVSTFDSLALEAGLRG